MCFSKGLFAAQDVIECMKPWYLIGSIFGISPYKITDKYIQIRLTGIVYTTGLFVFFFYAFVDFYPKVKSKSFENINQLISIGDFFINMLATIWLIFAEVINTKKSFLILKKIVKLDESFKTLHVTFQHENVKLKGLIRLLIAFSVISFLHLFIYRLTYKTSGKNVYGYEQFMTYDWWIHQVLRTIAISKSHTMIIILKNRFEAINKELSSELKAKTSFIEVFYVNNPDEEKFDAMRKLHDELCDVCEIFNSCIETQTICGLLLGFTLTITNVYYSYNEWYHHDPNVVIKGVHNFAVALQQTVFAFALVPGLADVSKEANRTGVIVCKLAGKAVKQDIKVQNQLNLFSQQLLHRRVQFTGKDFFPLDYSLIYSIAGSITMYLVILIQFQNIIPPVHSNLTGYDL